MAQASETSNEQKKKELEPRTGLKDNNSGTAIRLTWEFLDRASRAGVLGQVTSLLRGLPGADASSAQGGTRNERADEILMKERTVGRIRRALFGHLHRGLTFMPPGSGELGRVWFEHPRVEQSLRYSRLGFEARGVTDAWEQAPNHYQERYLAARAVCEQGFKRASEEVKAEPKSKPKVVPVPIPGTVELVLGAIAGVEGQLTELRRRGAPAFRQRHDAERFGRLHLAMDRSIYELTRLQEVGQEVARVAKLVAESEKSKAAAPRSTAARLVELENNLKAMEGKIARLWTQVAQSAVGDQSRARLESDLNRLRQEVETERGAVRRLERGWTEEGQGKDIIGR